VGWKPYGTQLAKLEELDLSMNRLTEVSPEIARSVRHLRMERNHGLRRPGGAMCGQAC
jgi:Leucine-rich repeat (LRR) protein